MARSDKIVDDLQTFVKTVLAGSGCRNVDDFQDHVLMRKDKGHLCSLVGDAVRLVNELLSCDV